MAKGKKPLEKYMPTIPRQDGSRCMWGYTVNQQKRNKKIAAKNGGAADSYKILDELENIK